MGRRIKVTKVRPILNSTNRRTQERLHLVESKALELMAQHGVSHFKFKFSGARRRSGSCSSNTISLSINHALYSDIKQFIDTILHEIAHAIVGVSCRHREKWQIKAKELGVTWEEGRYRK